MDIALADAVEVVRNELLGAATRGAKSDVQFDVSEVVLEFAVELREDHGAELGFKAWVVSLGADASRGQSETHRVSVTLHPQGKNGDRWLVAGDSVRPEGPGDVSGRIGR